MSEEVGVIGSHDVLFVCLVAWWVCLAHGPDLARLPAAGAQSRPDVSTRPCDFTLG